MSDSDEDELEPSDLELFDCSDVTWEIEDSKRSDQIKIILKTEGRFNLLKTYLSLKMITEKIELELNIMDTAKGEH